MIAFDLVSKRYGTNGAAGVKNLSLTVGHREFLVLITESGCGKTTARNRINRLIAPSARTILQDGKDIAAQDTGESLPPHRLCLSKD